MACSCLKYIYLFKTYLYAASERETYISHLGYNDKASRKRLCLQSFSEQLEESVLSKNFIMLPNLGPLQALKTSFSFW